MTIFLVIRVRFRIVEQLYLALSIRIPFKCGIIPSMHSASGIRDAWWNNMFAFRRFLDAADHHCTVTFVYKIQYWHVQRWLLDFIVDSSHVEPLLRRNNDGETRSKKISFRGFWETGIAHFLMPLSRTREANGRPVRSRFVHKFNLCRSFFKPDESREYFHIISYCRHSIIKKKEPVIFIHFTSLKILTKLLTIQKLIMHN